jgi:hypothetical protein
MLHLNRNEKSKEGHYNILIDNRLITRSWAFKPISEPDSAFQYSANLEQACWELASQTLEDFEPFSVINLNNIFPWMYKEHSVFIFLEIDEKTQNEIVKITFYLTPNLTFWSEPYSFADYFDKFETFCKMRITEQYEIFFEDTPALRLEYVVGKSISPIESILGLIYEDVKFAHEESVEALIEQFSMNSLLGQFDFPAELKIPCEQYLLYFAQFLQDLGINATSNLTEEAGKVLFSVTPTDDKEALGKIREALAIYLSLASNPIPNSTGDRTVDMVLSGARANAKHLESQLELTVAKLQFKEATLELKDATIGQNQLALRQKDETIKELQEIISRGNIFEESLEKVEINGEVIEASDLYRFSRGEDDDIEISATPILEEANEETKVGLVKFHEVTKFKDYGASFDLPQLIRDLMKYFNRNKD